MTVIPGIGQSLARREDDRLLRGQGRFVSALKPEGLLHAVFLRSSHARARIDAIDTRRAQSMPGIAALITAQDLRSQGVRPIGFHAAIEAEGGGPMSAPPRAALAEQEVRYVGEPIVMVVAQSVNAALDAIELIDVRYETLPCVSGIAAAIADGAPSLWPDAPRNTIGCYEYGDARACSKVFDTAPHTVRLRVTQPRVAAAPLEPRAALAIWDKSRQHATLHSCSQTPHMTRQLLCEVLDLSPEQLTVRVGDIGGGFGSKVAMHPEEALVLIAARMTDRPVRWVADRSESFLADTHGRDHLSDCELALDGDGRFLALRVRDWADMGAYPSFFGVAIATRTGNRVATGAYHIPTVHAEIRAVITNTAPTGPYRGAGRPETIYRLERLIDVAARQLNLDPAELRRRNLIRPEQIPYTNVVGQIYDSGDFPAILQSAIARSDWTAFATRKAESLRGGKLRGRGICYHIDSTSGLLPSETATITVEPDAVTVLSGTQAMGQGLETTYSQLVAAILRVPPHRVRIIQGDTDRVPSGVGSYGSRSLYIGGAAIVKAAQAWLAQAGIDETKRSFDVFELVRGTPSQSLSATATATSPFCFPNGCHVCEVEIDRATGETRVVRYTAVDDVGTVVHPVIVEGQTLGAVAQGIGQALAEQIVHDGESGQLLSGSFMDYVLPRADWFCPIDATTDERAPSTTGILGAKGAGEGGALGAPPAVVSAVCDALRDFDIAHLDMPLWPEKIWRIIHHSNKTETSCKAPTAAAH